MSTVRVPDYTLRPPLRILFSGNLGASERRDIDVSDVVSIWIMRSAGGAFTMQFGPDGDAILMDITSTTFQGTFIRLPSGVRRIIITGAAAGTALRIIGCADRDFFVGAAPYSTV